MEYAYLVLFLFILFGFSRVFDKTNNALFSFLTIPSIFLFFLGIVEFNNYKDKFVSFNDFDLSGRTYFFGIALVTGYVFSLIIGARLLNKGIRKPEKIYSQKKIRYAIFFMAFCSFAALLINLSNVGFNVLQLFTNAREYEKNFGKNWIINYLYFLHVPCLMLIIYYINSYKVRNYLYLSLAFMLYLSSFFHGIKFTVFDAMFFPLFMLISMHGFKTVYRGYLVLLSLFFILFFALFSYGVRGGGDEFELLAIFNYLMPNYINLFYVIEKSEFIYSYPFDAFLGAVTLEASLPRELPEVNFWVNDKYNMVTGLTFIIGSFYYFGSFVFYLAVQLSLRFLMGASSLINLFLSTYIMFSSLMMFYAYYFGTKYKYIYFFIVFIILHFIMKKRKPEAKNVKHSNTSL